MINRQEKLLSNQQSKKIIQINISTSARKLEFDVEVLFTLREYDLLNAVFACDEIPKPPKEQAAALKKAIR